MYVCMYMCMCVCVYVYVYVYMCVHSVYRQSLSRISESDIIYIIYIYIYIYIIIIIVIIIIYDHHICRKFQGNNNYFRSKDMSFTSIYKN